MEERIRGTFPGGPRHSVSGLEGSPALRIRSVEDLEVGIARRALDRGHRRRRTRIVAGFVVAMVAAGAVGAYVGYASHQTAETITAAREAAHQRDLDISWQVNRTLLQLWKMEDVEALRNQGLIR
jgi:hypothetical protein